MKNRKQKIQQDSNERDSFETFRLRNRIFNFWDNVDKVDTSADHYSTFF